MTRAVVIAGPTASGKTELALALARELRGEVISADSRQVYRGLDAGTAKPARDPDGRVEGIPYHLIDCLDPRETFDAGRFASSARRLWREILERGRAPIIAGGTGLYLRALLEGLSPLPPRDPALRRLLEESGRRHGRRWLYERLSQADPEAALKIPANNLQRTVRALEVFELTGRPISSFWAAPKAGPELPGAAMVLRLDWPAPELKARVESRARDLWPAILAETRRLLENGLKGSEPGFESLGYREAVLCLHGKLSLDAGFSSLARSTWAYARRQRTWFSRQLEAHAVIPGGPLPRMLCYALRCLRSKGSS